MLISGFSIDFEKAVDVYFDDPCGVVSGIQLLGVCVLKIITGQWRSGVKLWMRRGSGLFFLARKQRDAHFSSDDALMAI